MQDLKVAFKNKLKSPNCIFFAENASCNMHADNLKILPKFIFNRNYSQS